MLSSLFELRDLGLDDNSRSNSPIPFDEIMYNLQHAPGPSRSRGRGNRPSPRDHGEYLDLSPRPGGRGGAPPGEFFVAPLRSDRYASADDLFSAQVMEVQNQFDQMMAGAQFGDSVNTARQMPTWVRIHDNGPRRGRGRGARNRSNLNRGVSNSLDWLGGDPGGGLVQDRGGLIRNIAENVDAYGPNAQRIVRESLGEQAPVAFNPNRRFWFDPESIEAAIPAPVVNPPDYLSPHEIAKIPTRKYVKRNRPSDPDECDVCLMSYKTGDVIKKLPCKHEFHEKCIDSWLRQKSNCPKCRGDVRKAPGRDPPASRRLPGNTRPPRRPSGNIEVTPRRLSVQQPAPRSNRGHVAPRRASNPPTLRRDVATEHGTDQ